MLSNASYSESGLNNDNIFLFIAIRANGSSVKAS